MCQGDGNQTSGQTASALSAGLGDQVMRGWPPLLSAFRPSFISHYMAGDWQRNFNILSGAETLLYVRFGWDYDKYNLFQSLTSRKMFCAAQLNSIVCPSRSWQSCGHKARLQRQTIPVLWRWKNSFQLFSPSSLSTKNNLIQKHFYKPNLNPFYNFNKPTSL